METAPAHLDPEEIHDALVALNGVDGVHCLHVWTIGSGEVSLSSHLVITPERDPESLLRQVQARLRERFSIEHTTIQIETSTASPYDAPACDESCESVPASPHSAPSG